MQSQSPESIPPECNEDVELIERFQQGDTAAFDMLFTRYQKRTYRLVQRFVPNPEDASDLTQDAFIRAYQGLGDFKSQCQFYSWLYRITVNLCIDFLRKKARSGSTLVRHRRIRGTADVQLFRIPAQNHQPKPSKIKS